MSGALDVGAFLAGYLGEVDEHLSASASNLLAVEAALKKGEASPKAVRELFRSLHTIKGLSAMVGVEPIVDLAHAMETALREADRAAGRVTPAALEALHLGLRAIEERVRALASQRPVPPAPPSVLEALATIEPVPAEKTLAAARLELEPELAEKLTPAEKSQLAAGVAEGRRALRVDFVPSAARAAEGITITAVRERIGAIAEIVRVVPITLPGGGGIAFALLILTGAPDAAIAEAAASEVSAIRPLIAEAPAATPASRPEPLPEISAEPVNDGLARPGFVRVEVARLDDALEKLSALVVTRFRLSRAVAERRERGDDVRDLLEILREHERQLRDLRASIMRARMISVAELLERVPLLVRGLARSTGKPVRVEIDAGKAELDKAVAERVFPAIVHLIRNAVDHAIEPVEERRRLGKPDEGLIRVTCFERSSSRLELAVSDDGRGIDRERVARAAGRSAPENDAALLDLITLPGLSTAAQASKTSGRGVGMDIVKRIAEGELGGELSVRTTPGAGTTFLLKVPLTLTIVDAFSFLCAGQSFVVPVAGIEEILEVDPARVVRSHVMIGNGRANGGRGAVGMIQRRGEVVPLFELARVFDLPLERPPPKALVVRRNGAPYAFAIDRMLGQQEVVVRPLEDPLVRSVGVSGSTDLGDGRPTLVLDLVALSGRVAATRSEVVQ